MRDPKQVLTGQGQMELQYHLFGLDKALFFLRNHADDLALDALKEGALYEALLELDAVLERDKKILSGEDSEYEYMSDED